MLISRGNLNYIVIPIIPLRIIIHILISPERHRRDMRSINQLILPLHGQRSFIVFAEGPQVQSIPLDALLAHLVESALPPAENHSIFGLLILATVVINYVTLHICSGVPTDALIGS